MNEQITATYWTDERVAERIRHADEHGTRLPVLTLGGPLIGETQYLTHIEWAIWVGHGRIPTMLQLICCAPGRKPKFGGSEMIWLGRYVYYPPREGLAWSPLPAFTEWWLEWGDDNEPEESKWR